MTFRVALTFDAEHPDRPTQPGVAESILDRLEGAGARASFFVQGRWALAYPGTARRIPAAGHLVGNHSHYHAQMPLFSPAGLATDVRDAEAAICDVLGVDPRPWFRCPFGHGHDDPAIVGGARGSRLPHDRLGRHARGLGAARRRSRGPGHRRSDGRR